MRFPNPAPDRPAAPPAPPAPRVADHRDVPILINSFNRLHPLRLLIEWLLRAGHRNLLVLDNASSFAPLLGYLARLERDGTARVIRLGENLGHLAPWRPGLLATLGIDTEYVYTDPDIIPDAACPSDLVARLQTLLRDEPGLHKAGPGLRVDNVPASYRHRSHVMGWERQYWMRPAAPGVFLAPIDTTFALYRPGGTHGLDRPAARLGWPFLAEHLGWWIDEGALSEENRFYRASARRDTSNWAFREIDPRHAVAPPACGAPVLLRLGTGPGPWHGYLNRPVGKLDLTDGVVEAIHADAVFPRLWRDKRAWPELRRVLRLGGRMVVRGPVDRLTAMLDTRPAASRPALARWLRPGSPKLGAGWAVDRLTLTASPADAILHLRAVTEGDRPPPPVLRWQCSRLDLDADFTTVLPA